MVRMDAGSRVRELGDRLEVEFRPRRQAIVFLIIWLLFWTIGGAAAMSEVEESLFVAVWLVGWAAGEVFVAGAIAWMLFGRIVLIVTTSGFEVRKQLGRFARTAQYDAAHVVDVVAARVPAAEDEGERKDFCLVFSYRGENVLVGEGMTQHEAELVAATVGSRLGIRSTWADPRTDVGAEEHEHTWAASGFGLLVLIAVVVGIAISVLQDDSPRRQETTAAPASRPRTPPRVDAFAQPADYAAALTRHIAAGQEGRLLGPVKCAAHATWTAWTCSARVRPSTGWYAGKTVLYRCRAEGAAVLVGGRIVRGTSCLNNPVTP